MTLFIALKVVHVLAAIVAVGANVTYAFWLRRAGADRESLLFTIDGIRRLDGAIANPAYIVLFVTGILMVATGQYSFEDGWIAAAIALYVMTAIIGIALFAPALRRQQVEAERDPGSALYAAAANRTTYLGLLTTAIVLFIVYLMVAKPF